MLDELEREQKREKAAAMIGAVIGFLVGIGVVILAVKAGGATFGFWTTVASVLVGALFGLLGWLLAGMAATGDGAH